VNPISPELVTGTIGELLVQLRLLEFRVQAAPPIKDSGNDLIAVRGPVFCAIQVRSTAGKTYSVRKLPKFYHVLAVVHILGEGRKLYLDGCRIFFIPKPLVPKTPRRIDKIGRFEICQDYIDILFRI
jgi:hypothetical protein